MSSLSNLEARQDACFVLWALRTANRDASCRDAAGPELMHGFMLAGVHDSIAAFHDFTRALFAMQWSPTAWHRPRCGCVSPEEVFVLNALAEAATRQRNGNEHAARWWRLVLPDGRIDGVDAAARLWLLHLELAGVTFPAPERLHSCLQPLECITGPARPH